jgi:hypothetical protein
LLAFPRFSSVGAVSLHEVINHSFQLFSFKKNFSHQGVHRAGAHKNSDRWEISDNQGLWTISKSSLEMKDELTEDDYKRKEN